MKQLDFRHFNINRKKFTVTVNFSQKETKSAPKRPILFCLVPRNFQPFSDDSRSFQKTSENSRRLPNYRRFPRRNPKIQYSPGFPEYCCAWVKKRDYSPFEHRLEVHGPTFEEQIRIYNTKRLGFSRKTLQTLYSIFSGNSKQ